MPYVCRVRITNQKDLDGIADDSVRARMSRGERFHVREDPGPLKHVWERYHQRGNLSVERSPLRDRRRVKSLAEECERVTEFLEAFDITARSGRMGPFASSTVTAVGEHASLHLEEFREAVEAVCDVPWWKQLFVMDSLRAEAQSRRRDALEALRARAGELESQLVEYASLSLGTRSRGRSSREL